MNSSENNERIVYDLSISDESNGIANIGLGVYYYGSSRRISNTNTTIYNVSLGSRFEWREMRRHLEKGKESDIVLLDISGVPRCYVSTSCESTLIIKNAVYGNDDISSFSKLTLSKRGGLEIIDGIIERLSDDIEELPEEDTITL